MKTAEQLQKAIEIKSEELSKIQEKIESAQVWLDASSFMQSPDLFISVCNEKKSLQERENILQTQIKFLKWILE